VPKFTGAERTLIKSIVASLSIKRITDAQIMNEVFSQTNKTLSRTGLYRIRQQIKKESYQWYKTMRDGQYEYIHEFKEKINEILDLQRRHYAILDANEHNPQIQQTSLAELHRLSITLSNLYDVAPTIIGVGKDATISITPETKTSTTTREFIV
jgi:hypothetical protein